MDFSFAPLKAELVESPRRIRFFPTFSSGLRRKTRSRRELVLEMKMLKFVDQVSARQRMDLYCEAHPGSPSAVRRPRLSFRSGVWTAILGRSVREGIVGFGPTVEAALRAFDAQYLETLHPVVQTDPRLKTDERTKTQRPGAI